MSLLADVPQMKFAMPISTRPRMTPKSRLRITPKIRHAETGAPWHRCPRTSAPAPGRADLPTPPVHATLVLAVAIGLSANLPTADAGRRREVAPSGVREGDEGAIPGTGRGGSPPYRLGRHG